MQHRRHWLWIGLTLAAALKLWASDVVTPERLQLADGLYARGMYGVAAPEYAAYLRDYPTAPQADVVHFRLGECYRHIGSLAAAEREFRAVFKDYPESEFRLRAGFRRADLFMETGQYDAAIDLFTLVLKEKLPPDLAAASLYLQGEAYLKSNKPDEAAAAFEQVRDRYGDSPYAAYARLSLGAICGERGETEKALALYGEVVARGGGDRTTAEALFQTAEAYFRARDFTRSAESYRSLLTRFPGDRRTAEARLQSAWAAQNAGLFADALRQADEALQAKPAAEAAAAAAEQAPEWLYLKANAERHLLRAEQAIQSYSDLIRRYPKNRFADAARYEKSLTLYKSRRFEDAVAELSGLKPEGELRQDVYWLLAESYAALKRQDDAVQYYRIITREFPSSRVACDAAYRLGHHLQQRGEFAEAARNYTTVHTRFPSNELAPQALFAAAFCEAKDNRYADAVRDWAAVVTRYPDSAQVEESIYQQGLGELRLKRDQEALGTLRELLRRFPQSAFLGPARYWEGMLLSQGGQWEDAEASLRLAAQHAPSEELKRESQFRLALALQKNGKLDEAADLLQTLVKSPIRTEFSPEMLQWIAEFRLQKKNYREAIEPAQLLTDESRAPEWRQTGWGLVGRAHLALGATEPAADAFRKSSAVKAKTRYAAASALYLGQIEGAAGQWAEAAEFFRKAAGLASGNTQVDIRAEAYAGLGRAAKAQGDNDNAARYFMGVAVLYDDPQLVPECLYEAAMAFRALGRQEECKTALAELAQRHPDSEWSRKAAP